MEGYFVYAIKSIQRNYIYVGMTNNLERRIIDHNNGRNRSTKAYIPFELIFSEVVQNRNEARKREKYLKTGSGRNFIKSLMH